MAIIEGTRPSHNYQCYMYGLLPTGSEERGVLGPGTTPVAILPSCQDMKSIAF